MRDFIEKVESPFIAVHQERCVLVRNRNADCLRCAAACTSGCIRYDGAKLVVSPDLCIGCGTCATVCPTCALEAHHPSDADLVARCRRATHETGGVVCIACARSANRDSKCRPHGNVVDVECLGRVEEALLTRLAADGVREIALVHGACESCERNTGRATAELVLGTERLLLDAWQASTRVYLSDELPACVREYDGACGDGADAELSSQDGGTLCDADGSRGVSASGEPLRESAQDEGASPRYLKVMDDGTLPHFVPDRRGRLLDALADLGSPKNDVLKTRLWGRVSIDSSKCSSCRMCATFCPTGAISKYDNEDGVLGIEHYPADCVQCACCTEICPTGALTLSDEVSAEDMLSGSVWRYEMDPIEIERCSPHTIWRTMRTMMKTDQVFER